MLFRSVIVLALLSLATSFTLKARAASGFATRSRRSVAYQGPPAPLNEDGTVALTPELRHAKAAHGAAVAQEFQRLHEAESLAAAHPDHTSPIHDYGSIYGGQYNHESYNSALSSQGASHRYNPGSHIPAPLNHDGTVALTPEVQHAKDAHSAALAQEFQRLQEAQSLAAAHPDYTSPSQGYGSSSYSGEYKQNQYDSVHYNPGAFNKYNPKAHIPAPLNHDGTVAQTSEYKAIAASHQSEYAKAIHNLKHQDPHFQHQAALGYSWH